MKRSRKKKIKSLADARTKKMLQGFRKQVFKDKKKEAKRRASRDFDWKRDLES